MKPNSRLRHVFHAVAHRACSSLLKKNSNVIHELAWHELIVIARIKVKKK